jgi:hypothetical protein
MGYAICDQLSEGDDRFELRSVIEEFPKILESWMPSEVEVGMDFADYVGRDLGGVFVAGGSLFGSAMFSAAKAIEAAGVHMWAQELEEWAHLEYFCEPGDMPTWFLSSSGRTASREGELINAAKVLGRRCHITRWEGSVNWSADVREATAPLALWPGPTALAVKLAENFGEEPFRGFGGGRSAVEGGGASRIRSSEKFSRLRNFIK